MGGLLLMAGAQLAWLGLAAEIARAFEAMLHHSVGLASSALRFFSAQSALVIMAIGIPAMAAGLVLATLYELSARYRGGAGPIGRVTAWHYSGAIVGAAGAAFALLPALGMSLSLTATSAVAVLMATARGRQAHLEHQYATAEALLQRALSINAELPDARFDLALIATQRGDHHTAVAHLQTLMQTHPDFSHARFNLGVSLYHLGRYPEAAKQFVRVIHVTPESVDARFNLANSLAQSGQYDEAVEHYQQTLRLDPTHHQARHNLNEIGSWQRRRQVSQ